MKPFQPVVLCGDLEAAKNHRGFNLGDTPHTGRHTFVMSGVFVGQSNHLQIMSTLRGMGFVPRTTVNRTTAIVIYSSDIDAPTAMTGKLAAAMDNEVPFVLNEAAACELLDIIFTIPKTRKEQMSAIAEDKRFDDPGHYTGRSSRLALGYILEAWNHQGRDVGITDHFPTTKADVELAHTVRDMIVKLDLRGFTVDRTPGSTSVVFNGY